MKNLKIKVDCGEIHCERCYFLREHVGDFSPFVGYWCDLYNKEVTNIDKKKHKYLKPKRCQQCLEAEIEE